MAGLNKPVLQGGNHSFESPWLAGPYYVYNPSGGAWTFAGASGVTGHPSNISSGNPAPPDGGQTAFLQGGSYSVISQSVTGFQSVGSYNIRFKAAQRGNFNQGGQDFDVYLDSTLLGTFYPSGTSYQEMATAAFTTTAGTHTLKFVGRNSTGRDNTALIDEVHITANGRPADKQNSIAHAANETTVILNFDDLPHKNALGPAYSPHATFSTTANQSVVTFNPTVNGDRFTVPESSPNTLSRADNFFPWAFNHFAPLTVSFTKPVNALQFAVGGIDAPWGTIIAQADVYQNGNFVVTRNIPSLGTFANVIIVIGKQDRFPTGVDGVTKIVIRDVADTAGIVFDDFIFNVPTPPQVNITSPRVSGNLQGTTQNALLGGDVTLQAVPSISGGTYSWSITGPHQRISVTTTEAVLKLRWTEPGAHRVTVNYTVNGATASSFVNVNVIEPVVRSFSAVQRADQVRRDAGCSHIPGVTYTLGCAPPEIGIEFSATADIPPVAYLSDPAQSGIKYVQATSILRKRLRAGNFECVTKRTSESNVASGWQLDTFDPYDLSAVARFNAGASLSMQTNDSPGSSIASTSDAYFVDDTFEMYVYYFTGSDPGAPAFQRPLKLQGTGNFARLAWRWGGQVIFIYDQQINAVKYRITNSTTPTGTIQASSINAVVPMQSNVANLSYQPCPGAAVTTNPIDGSIRFVEQQYDDFLGRMPDRAGLEFWRSQITQCAFDAACIDAKRVDVSRAFFYSGDFIAMHPELGGPRGTHEYNRNFVLWCYRTYLQREPNDPPDNNWDGYNYWVGVLDSTNPSASDYKYNQVIRAFILSEEYRSRF